jgi:hypothetical protein
MLSPTIKGALSLSGFVRAEVSAGKLNDVEIGLEMQAAAKGHGAERPWIP